MSKFTEEYQIHDKQGNPVGPTQIFHYDDFEDLARQLKVAHLNVGMAYHEQRLANKLGTLMEPDPDRPLLTFEPRPLSADELVRVNNLAKDPRTAAEANKILLEAELGAPLEDIRRTLRTSEENSRIQSMRYEIELFKAAHPEYVESESNRDTIIQFVTKKKWALTKKNLELAFEELSNDGLLTVQAAAPPVPEPVPVPEPTPVVAVVPPPPEPLPAPTPTIPVVEANVPPVVATIPPEPETRPLSSSGLSRASGSVNVPPVAPKAKGITRAEIAKMTSEEYGKKLRTDPVFAKQVDALLAER